ncbi:hypothetical protein [Pseudomonas sp. MUP55]|uniref:hypothetical protein n=1 Tax=Pseudomonas sp. MUP55 TaxID=3087234 RepID=UPI0039B95AA9
MIDNLDGPRTAQQELFYDLEDAGAVIGWSVVELTAMAAGLNAHDQAAQLLKVCALLGVQQKHAKSRNSESAGPNRRAEASRKAGAGDGQSVALR